MKIEWSEDLSTGNTEIDKQHIELLERINRLVDSCSQGRGADEVAYTISFLEDYVVKHFGTEERYMQDLDYPEYLGHKALHHEYINNISEIKEKLRSEGPTVDIVVKTNRLLAKWLIDHIRNVDKRLGAYISQKDNK